MENSNHIIQPFGFSEMYEWVKIPKQKLGLFVQFSKRYPNMIEPFHDYDGVLAGISTINSVIDSDDPDEWRYAYLCNEVGDHYMKKERLAVGVKQYDQNLEMSYIATMPYEHFKKMENEKYDKTLKYVKRSTRNEWVRVNMIGKAIVIDNGKCKPGEYCRPYIGVDPSLFGTAVPYDENDEELNRHGMYVLERFSENSIIILNNSLCNK